MTEKLLTGTLSLNTNKQNILAYIVERDNELKYIKKYFICFLLFLTTFILRALPSIFCITNDYDDSVSYPAGRFLYAF